MNKQSENKKPKNKTLKKLKQDANIMKLFIGTKNLPITNVIKYIKDNYANYVSLKAQANQQNKNILYLDDCFTFQSELPLGNKQLDIDTTAVQKKGMPLDKLIGYSFYMMTPYMFVNNNNKITSLKKTIDTMKYQIGKDVKRTDIILNGTEYNYAFFSTYQNYYETTDQYCKLLVDKILEFSSIINYDNINKILLLTCQNMFNLITDLIVIKVNEIANPESSSVFRPEKNIIITLTERKQIIEYKFTTSLVISRNGEPMNPEYPCGNCSFTFYVDLLKDTFGFSSFQLSYDIDRCGPELENAPANNNNNNDNNNNDEKSSINWKYAFPAAIGVAGIAATPFIIAALGGKRKNSRRIYRNKTKKNKNKYKF
jgi:hypothetical protein